MSIDWHRQASDLLAFVALAFFIFAIGVIAP